MDMGEFYYQYNLRLTKNVNLKLWNKKTIYGTKEKLLISKMKLEWNSS